MGHLFYGTSTEPIQIPDRLLAHIKVVVTTKLRRSESFTLSWTHVDGTPGRSALWLQPAIPLRFVFDSAEPEALSSSNSSAGLTVDLTADIPTTETAPRAVPARTVAPAGRRRPFSVAA